MTPRVTVFTPAYNRGYILDELYESLRLQTCRLFRWHIVDDGSTDGTGELVAHWRNAGDLDIRYSFQENGGKQRAHNLAVSLCDTELFICVDSDDVLTPNAIARLLEVWDSITERNRVAGIVALRGVDAHKPLGTRMPAATNRASLDDLYHVHKFRGDTALLFVTEVLKRYPFKVAHGEKFIGEGSVYIQIDQHYDMALLDEILYVCRYQHDGYTANVRALTKANPVGYRMLNFQAAALASNFRRRFACTVRYLVGCRLSGYRTAIRDAPSRPTAILAYPVACAAYVRFFR